jgi:hypothetical protein
MPVSEVDQRDGQRIGGDRPPRERHHPHRGLKRRVDRTPGLATPVAGDRAPDQLLVAGARLLVVDPERGPAPRLSTTTSAESISRRASSRRPVAKVDRDPASTVEHLEIGADSGAERLERRV